MRIAPLGNLHLQVNNVQQQTPKLMLGILNMREPFPSYWQAFFPRVSYQEILEPSQRAPVSWKVADSPQICRNNKLHLQFMACHSLSIRDKRRLNLHPLPEQVGAANGR